MYVKKEKKATAAAAAAADINPPTYQPFVPGWLAKFVFRISQPPVHFTWILLFFFSTIKEKRGARMSAETDQMRLGGRGRGRKRRVELTPCQ